MARNLNSDEEFSQPISRKGNVPFKPHSSAKKGAARKKALMQRPKRHYLMQIQATVDVVSDDMQDVLGGQSLSVTRDSGLRMHVLEIDDHSYGRFLRAMAWGVTDWIASAMIGIPPNLLYKWLRLGQRSAMSKSKRDDPYYRPYICLYLDTLRAKAVARMTAEIKVALAEPLAWLKGSPSGKSQPGLAGWTDESIVHEGAVDEEAARAFKDREVPPEEKSRLMAAAIGELEKLGYISTTDEGKSFFAVMSGGTVLEPSVDADSTPVAVPSSNGHSST